MFNMNQSNVYQHRKDFLYKYLKEGNILDIGNIGGLYGDGVSNSFHLEIVKRYKDSTIYGFDLFLPQNEFIHLYPNQKQGDINDGLPYENNFFHTIYMGQVLEHVEMPISVLREIRRCLKDDGVFIFDIPNPYSINRIVKYLFMKKEDLGDPTHLIFYTPGSIDRMLSKTNLNIIEVATNWKLGKKYSILPKRYRAGLGYNLLVSCKKDVIL